MKTVKEISEDLINDKITINQARAELGYPEVDGGNRKMGLQKNEEFARNLFNDLKKRLNEKSNYKGIGIV